MYSNATVYEEKILQLSVPPYIVFKGILWFSHLREYIFFKGLVAVCHSFCIYLSLYIRYIYTSFIHHSFINIR